VARLELQPECRRIEALRHATAGLRHTSLFPWFSPWNRSPGGSPTSTQIPESCRICRRRDAVAGLFSFPRPYSGIVGSSVMFDATRMEGGEVSAAKGDGGDGVRKEEPINRLGRARRLVAARLQRAPPTLGKTNSLRPLGVSRGRARPTRWMGTAQGKPAEGLLYPFRTDQP
jgi:hypothetical protein